MVQQGRSGQMYGQIEHIAYDRLQTIDLRAIVCVYAVYEQKERLEQVKIIQMRYNNQAFGYVAFARSNR